MTGTTLAQSAGVPSDRPAEPPVDPMEHREPEGRPPHREGREMRPPPEDRLPETFDREAFKQRIENRIKELASTQARLQKALEKLDSGAPLTDVWGEIGPPGSERFTGRGPAPRSNELGDRPSERPDRMKPGKDARTDKGSERGPERGERTRRPGDMNEGTPTTFSLPQASGEPLSAEEREKLFQYLEENRPATARRLREWQKNDHDAFEFFLDRVAARVREAGAVLKRDPDGAKLRMNEVENGLDVLDAAQKLRALYAAGSSDTAALDAARVQLKQALSGQMDARYAVHQHQITTLESQIGELRKQAEEMSAKKEARLSERCEAFDANIRDRATRPPGEPRFEGKSKREGERKPDHDSKPDPAPAPR